MSGNKSLIYEGDLDEEEGSAIDMIDTFDRPAKAYAEGPYAGAGTYGGKRIPKAGVYAKVGYGRVGAQCSILKAQAKGPNASVGAEASLAKVGAMARVELGSVSANAGPVGAKLGLGLDTGASVGLGGVEVKVLGTGFSIGSKNSVSILGSEVSF